MKKHYRLNRFSHFLRLCLLCLAPLAFLLAGPSGAASRDSGFSVDDFLRLEGTGANTQGGTIAFSPDGERIAFLRERSRQQSPSRQFDLYPHHRCDVWVQLASGAEPINLTQGANDSSGSWAPQWSPDGTRLAFLSTRAGSLGLWMWDSRTQKFSRLSDRAPIAEDANGQPFVWMDNKQLVYPAQPDDKRAKYTNIVQETLEIASKGWTDVLKGNVSTASVLYANDPDHPIPLRQTELLLLNIDGGTRRLFEGAIQAWRPSPDGRKVGLVLKRSDTGEAINAGLTTAKIVHLDGHVQNGLLHADYIKPESLCWSPDSSTLAFLTAIDPVDRDLFLFRLHHTLGGTLVRPLPNLKADGPMHCAANGTVLLHAARTSADANQTSRYDWWAIDRDDRQTNLTGYLQQPELILLPERSFRSVLTVADGDVWRIKLGSGKAKNLTARFAPTITAPAWPHSSSYQVAGVPRAGSSYSQLVVAARDAQQTNFHVVKPRWFGTKITPLTKPTPDAQLLAYSPASRDAVLRETGAQGLFVWRSTATGPLQTLMQANEFLSDIPLNAWRPLQYTSLQGEPLTAWLLLPHNYESGKCYPLLTMLEPGTVFGASPPTQTYCIGDQDPANPHLAAGHGYAVLFPSMPLAPPGTPDDPLVKSPDGVLPAVQASIDAGIADPAKLYLFGAGGIGGYGVAGLITQTSMFHSAVAIGPYTNPISAYGTFAGDLRYTDRPHTDFRAANEIKQQLRMVVAPWRDVDRYARNTPVLKLTTVTTPVLMASGDMDYVPMMQAEELFRGLHRDGKRVALIRFWGEGHQIQSVPNIKELWAQIFSWLDTGDLIPAAASE